MLVQFTVKNYKTFREQAVLSLVASGYDKKTHEEDNVFQEKSIRLLRSVVVYGANASGKSKLIEALAFMKKIVYGSASDSQKGQIIPVESFLLNQETENKPSEFEIIFISENVQYRYGFEVTKEKVISEWLYRKEKVKEVEVFYREENKAEFHNTLFSNGAFIWNKSMVRDNALLLSVAAQFNDDIANKVVQYFSNEIKIISGIQEEGFEGFTIEKIDSDKGKNEILKMLKAADIGIEDLKVETIDKENLPKDMPDELKKIFLTGNLKIYSDSSVFTFHKKFDKQQKQIGNAFFSLEEESAGTKKYLALSGPILDVLKNGYTLVVDELDSKLHPNLVEEIVQLFNSKEINIKNAQLIFNTHNTNLLTSRLFRRDQIWFTEKNEYGEASLYSLTDFKTDKVRKTDAFESNYIRGKYGAVPFLNLFENFKDYLKSDEKEE